MAYHVYLGEMLCPVAPSKLQLKIGNKNKTLTLINHGEINIIRQPELTDISFDLLLPNVKYPFAIYKSEFVNASYYLGELQNLKNSKSPFQFIVTRSFPNGTMLFDTNMTVTLESYEIKEDVKQGFDVSVSIKLKQYKYVATKTYTVVVETPSTVVETPSTTIDTPVAAIVTEEPRIVKPRLASRTKFVVEYDGQSACEIAKKFYGDFGKVDIVTEENYWIFEDGYYLKAGTVLYLPALDPWGDPI